jgi:hypothetical protein
LSKLLAFIGSTIGSYAGWAIAGAVGFGIMGEFMVSMVGFAAGIYAGRRVADHYEL